MMVLMALVTTFMTSPVLERIYPRRRFGIAGRHGEAGAAPARPSGPQVTAGTP
jgi:hypothetical protein